MPNKENNSWSWLLTNLFGKTFLSTIIRILIAALLFEYYFFFKPLSAKNNVKEYNLTYNSGTFDTHKSSIYDFANYIDSHPKYNDYVEEDNDYAHYYLMTLVLVNTKYFSKFKYSVDQLLEFYDSLAYCKEKLDCDQQMVSNYFEDDILEFTPYLRGYICNYSNFPHFEKLYNNLKTESELSINRCNTNIPTLQENSQRLLPSYKYLLNDRNYINKLDSVNQCIVKKVNEELTSQATEIKSYTKFENSLKIADKYINSCIDEKMNISNCFTYKNEIDFKKCLENPPKNQTNEVSSNLTNCSINNTEPNKIEPLSVLNSE